MSKLSQYGAIISLYLLLAPAYAIEENFTLSITSGNSSIIGSEFPVYFQLINPTNQTLYNFTFKPNHSDGLVCYNKEMNESKDETSNEIETIPSKKVLAGIWFCTGRKIGTNNVSVNTSFITSNNKTHSASISRAIQILPCESNNCTLPIRAVGKIACSPDIMVFDIPESNESSIMSYFRLIKHIKPEASYKDLILTINSYEVEIPSNDTLKINYDFFIKQNEHYKGDNILNKIIFLQYLGNIKAIRINDINANIIEKGLFRIGHFDSKYFDCYGRFYELQNISYIDISGGMLEYPIEINKNYKLSITVEPVFIQTVNSLLTNFGIFMPVDTVVFRKGSATFNENLDGFINLRIWKEKKNLTRSNDIVGSFALVEDSIKYYADNKLEGFYTLERKTDRLEFQSGKVGDLLIPGYALLDYTVQLWEKEKPNETVEPVQPKTTTEPTDKSTLVPKKSSQTVKLIFIISGGGGAILILVYYLYRWGLRSSKKYEKDSLPSKDRSSNIEHDNEELVTGIIRMRHDINSDFSKAYGFDLLKEDELSSKGISGRCKNELDFNTKIGCLNIFIDLINIEKLKELINDKKVNEGSINHLERFLEENYSGYNRKIIENLKDLRLFRKKVPFHHEEKLNIFEKYGFLPPYSWENIWKKCLNLYFESLNLLKTLIGKAQKL